MLPSYTLLTESVSVFLSFILLFYVSLCVRMHTYMHVCTYVCVCECGGQRSALDDFLTRSLSYILRHDLSLDLEHLDSSRLCGPWAPGMLWLPQGCSCFQLPVCWDYRHAPLHLLFKHGLWGIEFGFLRLYAVSFYQLSYLPFIQGYFLVVVFIWKKKTSYFWLLIL